MQAFCGFSAVFLAFIIPHFDRFCTVYRIIEIIQLALIIKYNTYNRQAGLVRTDYTSIENIHKVIDPLFLDDLKAEFEEIKQISVIRTRDRKLRALQDKLTSLIFLDIKTPRLIQLNYSSADFAA